MSQLGYEKQGWISKNYDGFNNADLYFKGKSINLSIGGEYKLFTNSRFKLGILILPKIGYFYKENFLDVDETSYGLRLFAIDKNILFGLDSKLNIQLSITESIGIGIRPGYSWYSYFDANEYIHRSLSIDLFITRYL